MLIIGESINGTIPKVGKAILEKNEAFLRELARTQYECGAQMLDVNAGVAGGNEVADLPWLVEAVQREVPIPLMIDSASPDALKAAVGVYRHAEVPILNSISGEEEKWNRLFPVVSGTKSKVVVLCMDDQGIPGKTEGRIAVAVKLYDRLIASCFCSINCRQHLLGQPHGLAQPLRPLRRAGHRSASSACRIWTDSRPHSQ